MPFGPAGFAAGAYMVGRDGASKSEWVARQLARPAAGVSGRDPPACLDHVVILTSSISAICSTLTKHIIARVVHAYRLGRTGRFPSYAQRIGRALVLQCSIDTKIPKEHNRIAP